MQERERQGHQIFDDGPLAELIDFDSLKSNVMPLEELDDGGKMRTGANQDGDLCVTGVPHQLEHPRGFVIFVEEGVDIDSGVVSSSSGNAGGVGYGPRLDVVHRWKNRGEGLIRPFDEGLRGSKVDVKRQRLQPDGSDAVLAGFQKQADIGLPETVDGLHRIADQEQSAAIGGFPSGGQLFEQLELGEGGVLKFVHQDVLDAIADGEREVGGRLKPAESFGSADGQLGEIDAPAITEDQLELADGECQDRDRGLHGLPLGLSELRRRQPAKSLPCLQELVIGLELGEQLFDARL